MCRTGASHDASYLSPMNSAPQMEKRIERETGDCFQRCRLVLQRGLAQNPYSAQIMTTWGLTEVRSLAKHAIPPLLDALGR